ncbi:MAG: response regulator [Chloroflexi bacterium]|nr:response regulator [Chloroflexota bacterium]
MSLFAGTLALVWFRTRKNYGYLFVGIGFIGASVLDAYQAIVAGAFFVHVFPQIATTASPWIWNIPLTFLSLFMGASWFKWWRDSTNGRLLPRYVIVSGLGALLLLWIFTSLQTNADVTFIQIETTIATMFFAMSLTGYLYKKKWQEDQFEFWLVVSLIIFTTSQFLFFAFSTSLYDKQFLAAMLLKQLGYLAALIGLLQNMVAIFRQAELTAVELTGVNTAFQREINDRKRVEAAEYEQRQLAEALREIGVALGATVDFDELLDRLLDQISRVLPYDTANVMLVKDEEVNIVCTRGYDLQTQIPYSGKFALKSIPSLQQMYLSKEPLIISDTAHYQQWVNAEGSPHVRSWAGAPIAVQGQIVAFLALNNSEPRFYQLSDSGRLTAFASQAAIAIQNAQLYEQLQKRVDEQTTLNMISHAVTSTLDLQKTLTIITDETTRLLKVDATSVVLLDEKEGDLRFAAASGVASDFVMEKRLPLGQGILGWVALNGKPLLVSDTAQDKRHYAQFDVESGFQARSILCVPLQTKGVTIGAIEAINKETGPFNEEDLRLLTLLSQPVASAIENAQLYQKAQQEIAQRKMFEEALEAERTLLARRVEERTADLSAANAELAHAARLKDEFLASISHELRTPLNAVLGISEALQEEVYGALNEKQIGSLRSIEESGRHLLSLINDILDLSKVEAGKLELEIRPVSVDSVCQSSLRLIKQNAHKKRLKVSSTYDSVVNTVQADERRVKQILVNLLSNAVKFTMEGGEIGLEVVGDREKKLAHFTVWDDGIGISKDDISRLFRPFVQLDSRLAREYAGTGLGLSLVYRMVELHGGSVSVESELGNGSRFTISLPWQDAGMSLTPMEEAELIAADAPRLLGIKRALLIEDSPAATAQMIRYLGEFGLETITCPQGEGAWEKALVEQPDVIILDILLPDMPGWDVLRQLKAERPTRDIPVLIVSVIEEQSKAFELGASVSLVKPINRLQLQRALRQIVVEQIKHEQTMILASNQRRAFTDHPLILLAEDNEINIQTFSDYLLSKQYRLLVVRNGIDAVKVSKEARPDLILMDIQLPGMNGIDAIKEIRGDDTIQQMPIIAVTALAMPGDHESCLKAGATAYLSKPVRLKGLVEMIEQQLHDFVVTLVK